MQIDQCYDGSPLRISRYLICSSVRVLLSRFLDLSISLLALDFDQAAHPPGPPDKGLLSGNMRDIPVAQAWHTYMEWGKKYGALYAS